MGESEREGERKREGRREGRETAPKRKKKKKDQKLTQGPCALNAVRSALHSGSRPKRTKDIAAAMARTCKRVCLRKRSRFFLLSFVFSPSPFFSSLSLFFSL